MRYGAKWAAAPEIFYFSGSWSKGRPRLQKDEDRARTMLLQMLAQRAAAATVCPSEVARALAAPEVDGGEKAWRDRMPEVHSAVDLLVANGTIQLSWKGIPLDCRAGPYRIGRTGKL